MHTIISVQGYLAQVAYNLLIATQATSGKGHESKQNVCPERDTTRDNKLQCFVLKALLVRGLTRLWIPRPQISDSLQIYFFPLWRAG